jgi:hypothetical protein
MAENRGGFRPTAPQNNPANVSATGGAGQNGQTLQLAKGFAYGENKAINEQQAGATMYKDSIGTESNPLSALPPITGLTAPTERPGEHISTGMPYDLSTPGPDSLNLPVAIPQQVDPSREIIRALYQQNPRNEDLRYLVETMDAIAAQQVQ